MIGGLILAFQFITRIPINIAVDFNEENLGKSTFFYPLVGAVLGGLSAIVYKLFHPLNNEIASFFTVLSIIILTGGLHLDGLSDTADGFYSSRNKDRTLEIMKDSRIGAFGTLSLILIILFKYIVISSIPVNITMALILSIANGRLSTIIQIMRRPMAKSEGLGHMIRSGNPRKYIISSSIIYTIIVSIINPIYLLALVGALLTGEIIGRISEKKIDGITGDILGAIIELGETISLLIFMGVFLWK